MEELLQLEQNLRLNPYVTQSQKLSRSLKCLSQIFEGAQENSVTDTREKIGELEKIGVEIQEELCASCKESEVCNIGQLEEMKEVVSGLVEEIEEYGLELSVRNKRAWSKKCSRFEELKEKVEFNLREIKSNYVWEERLVQSKHASFVVLQALLKTLEEVTKEIDASLFQDERLERKISRCLKALGVRMLKVSMFVSNEGIYEVHISAKSKSGVCVTTTEMAVEISKVMGRRMEPEYQEGFVLREGYSTMVFVEPARYQILCGSAKKEKHQSKCSGDNFLVLEQSGGKKCALISDGMGSGVSAFAQSKLVLEMAEALLESGVSPLQTIEMVNALLATESKEVEFATLDMCVVDSYKGSLELFKAGAAATFVITEQSIKCYESSSLPVGVIAGIEVNHFRSKIQTGCYVVMMSDGVLEALAMEEREGFLRETMKGMKSKNPKELADNILKKSLSYQEDVPKDDMMVLALGIWEFKR